MTVKMEKHTARKYSSPIRERQANQTRTNILDATQRLFLERGYAKKQRWKPSLKKRGSPSRPSMPSSAPKTAS